MVTQSEKFQMLQELDEATFRTELLVPLLRKMGCEKVRETHGPDEFGKDITFYEPLPLGGIYAAVVAKVGNISGAASGRGTLATVMEQVNMAFEMPIEDVQERQQYRVSRVIVWTTGRISNHAERQIMDSQSEKFRNVVFIDGNATIELLEKHYPAFFTVRDPYVSDYYNAAKESYSRLEELRALGCSSEQHRLPMIFVSPILVPFESFRSDLKKIRDPKEILKTKRYSFSDLLTMPSNTVVVGEAGSGKSTLLRRILIHTIEENEQARRRSPIPILIEFKKLDFADEQGIEKALESELFRFNATGLAQELGADLVDGSMIVLLDGLDELKTEERIAQALDHVKDFSSKYPKTRVVLTSRLLEIFEKPDTLSDFRTLKIMNLTPTQMTEFIENWYGQDSQVGKKLVKFVRDPLSLRGLPATPLTLALVAILHESGSKEIPANLTELFEKYIELALGRWDVGRGISLQFEWKVKEFILRRISWEMHQQRESEIACSDFESAVERLGSERGLNVDSTVFCREVVDRSELLFRSDNDEYEFKHRSFQEYFVGAEINSRADTAAIAVANFLDPWWSQAIFFAFGLQPESEDYLKAIMNQVEVSSSDYLLFAMNLGLLTQATYLAPKPIKSEAVSRALDMFTEAWDYSCRYYAELEKKPEKPELMKELPIHVIFLGFLSAIAQTALGSITLSSVLSDLIERYSSQPSSSLSDRERAKREWYVFLLAMSSAQCDNIAGFVKAFESGIITEPSFLVLGQAQAKEIEERAWLGEEDRYRAEALDKRLMRKLRRYREYLRNLQNIDPIPLPSPDTTDDEQTTSKKLVPPSKE
jgi:hypothetical protein